jgi:acyl carrier protein
MDAIKQIIADELGIDVTSVDPHKTFADLGADSLDFVEILMETEDRLRISIPDTAFMDMETTRIGEFMDQLAKVLGVDA